MITYEQKKYKRKQTLGEYIYEEMNKHQCDVDVRRTQPMTWPAGFYFNSSDLEFWIQQFHCRKFLGHTEWSDKWQRNIWIPDEEEDMTVEPFQSYEDFKKEKGIDED